MPIPKEWSWYKRMVAWLTMGDFEQDMGREPLYWRQKFFRWVFKNRRKSKCIGCGKVFVPVIRGTGHCRRCLGVGDDGRFL